MARATWNAASASGKNTPRKAKELKSIDGGHLKCVTAGDYSKRPRNGDMAACLPERTRRLRLDSGYESGCDFSSTSRPTVADSRCAAGASDGGPASALHRIGLTRRRRSVPLPATRV